MKKIFLLFGLVFVLVNLWGQTDKDTVSVATPSDLGFVPEITDNTLMFTIVGDTIFYKFLAGSLRDYITPKRLPENTPLDGQSFEYDAVGDSMKYAAKVDYQEFQDTAAAIRADITAGGADTLYFSISPGDGVALVNGDSIMILAAPGLDATRNGKRITVSPSFDEFAPYVGQIADSLRFVVYNNTTGEHRLINPVSIYNRILSYNLSETYGLQIETPFSNGDDATYYLRFVSPVDSMRVYGFDGKNYMVSSSDLILQAQNGSITINGDSIYLSTTPTDNAITELYGPDPVTGKLKKREISTISGGGGSSTFSGLSDTPNSYSGEAGKIAAVNSSEDAIEFVSDSSILKVENTTTAATTNTTNNYHEGRVGFGDFSANNVLAPIHVFNTIAGVIRLSDSCITDSCALTYIEFFRGYDTSKLGDIGYTDSTTPDLHISNNIPTGGIRFETDNTLHSTLKPSGQWQEQEYGDSNFVDNNAILIAGWDDNGNRVEIKPYELGKTKSVSTPTVSASTSISFDSLSRGILNLDFSSISVPVTLSLSDPYNGGEYTFWVEGCSNDTIVFPDNFLSRDRDTLAARVCNTNEVMRFFYDGTNYITDDTLWVSTTVDTEFNPTADTFLLYSPWAYFAVDSLVGFSDTDPVDTLQDLSGNNRHLHQDSTDYLPTFVASAQNGKAALDFGVRDKMLISASSHTWTADSITVIAVIQSDDDQTHSVFSMYETGTDERQWAFGQAATATTRMVTSSDGTGGTTVVRTWTNDYSGAYHIVAVRVASDGSEDCRINASDVGSSGTPNGAIFDNAGYLALGGTRIPTALNPNFDGKILRIAVYDKWLSTAEVQHIEGFANRIYAIY